MPKTLVQAQTPDGETVSFAVDDASGVGPQRVSRENGAVIAKLDEPLDHAVASARPATETIINTFKALSPDEMTIEFGLNIDAQAGAVFAKAGIGAHFNITMKWTPTTTDTADAATRSASGSQAAEAAIGSYRDSRGLHGLGATRV